MIGRATGMASTGDDQPRLVPAYALTGGRTEPEQVDIPWEAVVGATGAGLEQAGQLRTEQARIVELCRRPVAVVEIGARLGIPVAVVRVLIADLQVAGLVHVHLPTRVATTRADSDVLHRLIAAVEAL